MKNKISAIKRITCVLGILFIMLGLLPVATLSRVGAVFAEETSGEGGEAGGGEAGGGETGGGEAGGGEAGGGGGENNPEEIITTDAVACAVEPCAIGTPSAPVSNEGITPIIINGANQGGNITCDEVGCSFDNSSGKVDYDDPLFTQKFLDQGITVIVTEGKYVQWTSILGLGAVIVKGSNDANVYVYPTLTYSDYGLAAPINASGTPAGLSNLTFCWPDQETCTPVNCQWGPWGPWSATCGEATRSRSIAVEAQCNGEACTGGSTETTYFTPPEEQSCPSTCGYEGSTGVIPDGECGFKDCPAVPIIDCQWGEWGDWVPTGQCGMFMRTREIAVQANACGQDCEVGGNSETLYVSPNDEEDCPTECGLKERWVSDGDCGLKYCAATAPCGGGGGGGGGGGEGGVGGAGGPVEAVIPVTGEEVLIIPVTGVDFGFDYSGLKHAFLFTGLMLFGMTLLLEGTSRKHMI